MTPLATFARTALGGLLTPLRRVARVVRTTRRTVAAVPDALEAILLLPVVAQRLEVVAFHTASLAEMRDEIARLRGDTAVLPRMDARVADVHDVLLRVDANTAAVQQLADVALPLQTAAVRLGRLADRFPQRRVVLPVSAPNGH